MTRDEIYDHLAQVYLGKKQKINEKKEKQVNAWLVVNILITVIIFASAFYGFTAFLTHRQDTFQNKIIYALNNGPIRIRYNLDYPYPPVKTFSLTVPEINVGKYKKLQFSVRTEEGYAGTMKVEVRNNRNELDSIFAENIQSEGWQKFNVPLEEFKHISDWSNVSAVSFILESWNIDKKKGVILIDDVCFSN